LITPRSTMVISQLAGTSTKTVTCFTRFSNGEREKKAESFWDSVF
jgi:hypothetical protein